MPDATRSDPGGARRTPPRVLVIASDEDPSTPAAIAGIRAAARARPGWLVDEMVGPPPRLPFRGELRDFDPTAILLLAPVPVERLPPLPRVAVRLAIPPHAVVIDEEAVGALAARHLLALGFRRFAFLAHPHPDLPQRWAEGRWTGMRRAVRDASLPDPLRLDIADDAGSGRPDLTRLIGCLSALPAGTAVVCSNDHVAATALRACTLGGIDVPGRLALVGADDAEGSGSLRVPLTSVRIPHGACGAAAVAMLEGLLAGRIRRPMVQRIAPEGVVERSSADALAGIDPLVAGVMREMRTRIGSLRRVDDLVAITGLGRRALERRFRAACGHSLLAAMQEARLQLACALLSQGGEGMSEIAAACGFANGAHLARQFRRRFATTPSLWRSGRTAAERASTARRTNPPG